MIWIVVIGCMAGLIANLMAQETGPRGLLLSTALGIGGALAATGLGRFAGLYRAGQSAGFIGAIVGAVLMLLGYHLIAKK